MNTPGSTVYVADQGRALGETIHEAGRWSVVVTHDPLGLWASARRIVDTTARPVRHTFTVVRDGIRCAGAQFYSMPEAVACANQKHADDESNARNQRAQREDRG